MINLTPFAFAWIALVLGIVGIALYRRIVSTHEDNFIHLDDAEARQIPNQIAVSRKLEAVDKLGKALTAIAIAGGTALTALYLYQGWMQNR